MGGKAKAPPPPDYGPVAAANQRAAELQYQLGSEQLSWAKEQYHSDKEVTDKVVNAALEQQAATDAAAKADRERYEKIYQPLEDSLVDDANTYASGERQDYNAGRAMSDVSQQFEQARQNAQQQLEQYGVDPSQTRAAALDISTRTQEAAARASAGNQSRMADEGVGRTLRSEAINVGKGYPGQIAQSYGTSIQAGQSAANTTLAQTASGASTMGTNVQYQGLGNQSNANWGNILLGQDRNNIARFQAQTEANKSSGIGSVLGLVGGLASKAFMFEEGGAVPEGAIPDDMPPSQPQGTVMPMDHQGVSVDPSMSPSQGAIPDDVPARLNAGEFVIPRDVVAYKGEEFFQRTIQSARKASQSPDNARPQTAAIPAEAPAVRTALPTG
jgi:hypothetical protein